MASETFNFIYKKYHYTADQYFDVRILGSFTEYYPAPENQYAVVVDNSRYFDSNWRAKGTIQLRPEFLNTISEGNYSTTINIYKYNTSGRNGGSFTFSVIINIQVINTIALTVSPSVLSFTYTPPGTDLLTHNIVINSENNWTITSTESWVVLGKTSGFGNDTVSVTADPSGLSSGAYSADLVINDGIHSRTVSIVFLVSGTITSSDYLRVNPTAAELLSLSGVLPTQEKKIRIESSDSYSTRFVNDLFTITNTEDLNGIDELTIFPKQQVFSNGVYQDTLEVYTTLTTVQVFLILTVLDTQTQTIESGGLYFVEDRDKISLVSTDSTTEALFNFVATLQTTNENYFHEVPFYRGIAETLVGQEVRSLLASVAPPTINTSSVSKLFDPVSIDLTISEKQIYSSTSVVHSEFMDLYFLNGSSPTTTNFLSKIPSSIHATPNGVIILSFYASSAPSDIAINGDIETNITTSSTSGSGVFSAIISLSDLGVTVSDEISIEVNGVSIQVSIVETELDETLFLFENQWQTYEAITLTGTRTISRLKGWDSTIVNKEGKRHTKLIEARSPRQFEIGIGKVYSIEELNWISEYFNSKRMFLEFEGERIEVEPLDASFPVYETNKTFYDEVLKFKEAIV